MNATLVNKLTGQPIADQDIRFLATLAQSQKAIERQIEITEEALTSLKDKLREISEVQIPEFMMQLGMSEFSLTDGSAVKIKSFVSAKIPEESMFQAFQWLRNNNYDAIIKRQISLAFGKGEDKVAQKLAADLQKRGLAFVDKVGVHPMTLKSFCTERIADGDPNFPRELFGVFEGKRTVITPPKN
jgi:hypothetical protein